MKSVSVLLSFIFAATIIDFTVSQNVPMTAKPRGQRGQFAAGQRDKPVSECDKGFVCKPIAQCPRAIRGSDLCGSTTGPIHVCCRKELPAPSKGQKCAWKKKLFSRQAPDTPKLVTAPVVGGSDAVDGEFPFMVAIYKHFGTARAFLCGGTLITTTWVVSAAHCFVEEIELPPCSYMIRTGDIDMDSPRMLEIVASQIVRHPEFIYPRLDHDIALMKLTSVLPTSNSIQQICLPPKFWRNRNFEDTEIKATGWGTLELGGKPADVLQEVDLKIVSTKQCNATFAAIGALEPNYPDGITRKVLCAGTSDGTKDTCQGDSGGPLITLDSDNFWTIIGIVSGGIGCATPGIPGTYTNVAFYVDWIMYVVSGGGSSNTVGARNYL